ncbi:helix-turn-helix transcriptional regulator [Micromonospora purpureochromogenes]|uniref:helix-turn-helix domain-containing protein n=1 Tax=Micromonospora purpureochromogenes TaxID=47872 RepID=UPI0033F929A5
MTQATPPGGAGREQVAGPPTGEGDGHRHGEAGQRQRGDSRGGQAGQQRDDGQADEDGLLRGLLRPARSSSVDLDSEERRLLRSIAAGRGTVEIAEQLHVSERTVKRMTAALLRKLRVSSRAEAAALAGHAGLLTD